MARFEIKPTKSTAYEHVKRVYGAMFDDDQQLKSVILEGSSVKGWNVNSFVEMVQFVKECAIIIDCDDGTLHIQRFYDGKVEVDGGTDWFTVKVIE